MENAIFEKYKFLEHPADIGLRSEGENLIEAFENAALGLYDLMFDIDKIESKTTIEFDLNALDLESLLVKFLTEILYFYETDEFIGKEVKISKFDIIPEKIFLKARIFGENFIKEKHNFKIGVKAVTYHQLKFYKANNRQIVEVFFDI